jgi:predicted aspartyl protease
MPVLHVRKSPTTAADPDGNEVDVTPPQILIHEGPVVSVNVGVPSDLADKWRNMGLEIPEPVSGNALIDTGATTTCIDDDVAKQLGLPTVDVAQMSSASGQSEQPVYPVQLDITHSELVIESSKSIGADLEDQGLVALIGRDTLSQCTLHYNGVTGDFTLSI